MLKEFILFTITNPATLLLSAVALLLALLIHSLVWSSLLIIGVLALDSFIYNMMQTDEQDDAPKPQARFKGTLNNKGGLKK